MRKFTLAIFFRAWAERKRIGFARARDDLAGRVARQKRSKRAYSADLRQLRDATNAQLRHELNWK